MAQLFSEYSLSDVLEDHGQVARTKALELQNGADVFLVLSWNTKKAKGILTGKFFEGIRAKKPMIAVVEGDIPESELKLLDRQYHYGFCYEASDKSTTVSDLADYIFCLYEEKASTGKIVYIPAPGLEDAFRYKTIVNHLDELAHKLCEEE